MVEQSVAGNAAKLEELTTELADAVARAQRHNRRYLRLAFALLALAVASSAGAAILALLRPEQSGVVAILAVLPGLLVLTHATFRFEDKARWFWRKRIRLKGLLNQCRFEGLPLADASKTLRMIEEELVAEWPGFDAERIPTLPGKPAG